MRLWCAAILLALAGLASAHGEAVAGADAAAAGRSHGGWAAASVVAAMAMEKAIDAAKASQAPMLRRACQAGTRMRDMTGRIRLWRRSISFGRSRWPLPPLMSMAMAPQRSAAPPNRIRRRRSACFPRARTLDRGSARSAHADGPIV